MRAHARPKHDTRIVLTGTVSLVADVPPWELELMAAAITSKVEALESVERDHGKGSSHAAAQP